jgi:hypothetical protein
MTDFAGHRPGADGDVLMSPRTEAIVRSLLEHRIEKVVGEQVRVEAALKLLEEDHTAPSLAAWVRIQQAKQKQEAARLALKEASAELNALVQETRSYG